MHNGEDKITPVAITNWRDIRKKFGIKEKNRRGHMYVVGKTGTGKSSLLGNMLISDLAHDNGVALIDPHGDLAEKMLEFVPPHRKQDVIYLNPGDLEYPVAFNPLRKVNADYRHLVVSGLISVFKKIWHEYWGPRLEHLLRNALFTLLECPDSTLLDISRLFTDISFRTRALSFVTQEPVRLFWTNEYERYSAWLKSEAAVPILNKVGQFLTSLPLRNIVGQSENTFSVRKVMDEGNILIANLSKGRIGEDNCALLGAMLVTQIQLATLSRANVAESKRRPFYLYVDEVHSFLTLSFADMLSESRKYGLNLVLAHQFTSQVSDELRNAIFGNVGTIISFRIGTEDARLFAREFAPTFEEMDFVNLPNHHIYLKLMIDGVTSEPFSATTIPLPKRGLLTKEAVIKASRVQFGRPRKSVETALLARYNAPAKLSLRQSSFL